MSPRRRPASAAGLPAVTSATCRPVGAPTLAATGGGSGTRAPTIPRNARRTRPEVMSWVTMPRVVALTGTASPTPMPATAVLTPTIRPALSASTPPELPGLSAASVWMTSSTTRPLPVGSERPSAETMPAVTLPASPSGLPSATTSCPTRSRAASPSSTGGGTSPRACSTARSDSGSRPTTSARTCDPSVKVATATSAPATTCADVSRKPSAVTTLAEPAPWPRGSVTARLATLGSTASATATTARE